MLTKIHIRLLSEMSCQTTPVMGVFTYYMITIRFLRYGVNALLGSNWIDPKQSYLYCKLAVSNVFISMCCVHVYVYPNNYTMYTCSI